MGSTSELLLRNKDNMKIKFYIEGREMDEI